MENSKCGREKKIISEIDTEEACNAEQRIRCKTAGPRSVSSTENDRWLENTEESKQTAREQVSQEVKVPDYREIIFSL